MPPPGLRHPPRPCHISHGESCDACVKVQDVESQIAAAGTSLDALLERRRQLRTEINSKHSAMIRLAPPEIISTIFEFAYPSVTSTYEALSLPPGFRKVIDSRLRLGAVCRAWRRIAWSTPRLWNELVICLGAPLIHQLEVARSWLNRSGGLPLAISVYRPCFEDDSPEVRACGRVLVDILNEHSDRWSILELNNIPADLYSLFAGNLSSTCILRSLTLKLYSDSNRSAEFIIKNAVPRPESVTLHGLSLKAVNIAWDNVTCAEVEGLRASDYLALLKQATKLQRLTIDFFPAEDQRLSSPLGPQIHDQLQELVINGYHTELMAPFLRQIKLPNLLALEVCSDGDEVLPFDVLSSWLQQSVCRLRELVLSGSEYGNSDIVDFLANIPSVELLNLSPISSSDHVPDELFLRLGETAILLNDEADAATPVFLPHLRALRYNADQKYCAWASGHSYPRAFPWKLLAGVFGPLSQLRDPRRRPLNSVIVDFDLSEGESALEIDKDCIPSLAAILEAGIDLEVCYSWHGVDLMEEVRALLKEPGKCKSL